VAACKKTHCKRGHERTPENRYKSGKCKTCHRIRNRRAGSSPRVTLNLIGQTKGLLRIVSKAPSDSRRRAKWWAECTKCFNRKTVDQHAWGKHVSRCACQRLLMPRLYRDAERKCKVLTHYGPNQSLRCCWEGCTVEDIDMLSLDHINNDGNVHRKSAGDAIGRGLYKWIIRNGYPAGFQTLCMNHQFKKAALYRHATRQIETVPVIAFPSVLSSPLDVAITGTIQ
jgi:hypothetical protein